MQVISSFQELAQNAPISCAATIGNFDGVHLGHQQLIGSMVEKARSLGVAAVVITFDPHPEHLLKPDTAPPLLMPLQAKIAAIKELGVDMVFVLPFDFDLARMAPDEFVQRILVDILHIRHLSIGHDYAFGKGRTGNAAVLGELGEKYGFTLHQLLPVFVDGGVVSSTRVRTCIMSGEIAEAAKLLGRPHCSEGTVVHGMNRGGKLLGFPTANVAYQPNIIVPKPGVYAVRATLTAERPATPYEALPGAESALDGVASIGVNPTFGDVSFGLEVFLLDFNGDIYGSYLRVYFIDRLRDEMKFPSVDALKEQIGNDVSRARGILKP